MDEAQPGDCSAPQEGCVYLNKTGNRKERRTSTSDSKKKRLFESGMLQKMEILPK